MNDYYRVDLSIKDKNNIVSTKNFIRRYGNSRIEKIQIENSGENNVQRGNLLDQISEEIEKLKSK